MSYTTDATADGNFGSAGSHRAGYGDKLANAERWARKGGTLNAGEGLILCEEIDRLREALKHETQWADAGIDSTAFWKQQRDDLAAKFADVKAERDDLREMANAAQLAETVASAELERMREECKEQNKRLAEVTEERDAAETNAERRWDDIIVAAKKIDRLRDELTQQSITLSAEHQRAERILAALREPSEAVLEAATIHYGDVRDLIIVAVAAAEREMGA